MQNVLLERVDYKVEETPFGTWRRFLSPTGFAYAEFTSRRRLFGLPLFAYTAGICPETGRRKMAKGVVALGKSALGVVAIGQLAIGLFPIGQFSLGLIFGLGQFSTGLLAVGQFALGGLLGFGQFTAGVVAIGQLALGWHVLAQKGVGVSVWSWSQAADFFRNLLGQ